MSNNKFVLDNYRCGNFTFSSNFDSGNLRTVELNYDSGIGEFIHASYNLWTLPDCYGTPHETPNRTWFFFSIKGGNCQEIVQLTIKNLNRQAKLFNHGMAPVVRIGKNGKWSRIKDRPSYNMDDENFELTFVHRVSDVPETEVFYAFTYPFTYTECQEMLKKFDETYKMPPEVVKSIINKLYNRTSETSGFFKSETSSTSLEDTSSSPCEYMSRKKLSDEIYYYRELLIDSLENRRIDLLTITSFKGIQNKREEKLSNLFPNTFRCHCFKDKKIIFLSSRVHPGETPASFVMNGFLNLLLDKKSIIANALRRIFVFKIIPILNPDGVYRGCYRTDTLGQNLNRMYLNPTLNKHPSIYAVKKLIRYYNCNMENLNEANANEINLNSFVLANEKGNLMEDIKTSTNVKKDNENDIILENSVNDNQSQMNRYSDYKLSQKTSRKDNRKCETFSKTMISQKYISKCSLSTSVGTDSKSPLFLYIDMHGHASKKGVFMYGNYFPSTQQAVECMLLPKLMSINSSHFHFDACNFSEKNMYRREKRDGLSKEGSGRVTVYKMTGLTRSYTLECNYNSGKYVNILPPRGKNTMKKIVNLHPPKYTPGIFEEVGRALGSAILDLISANSASRLQNSDFHNLQGIRVALRNEVDRSPKPPRSTSGTNNKGSGLSKKNHKTKTSDLSNSYSLAATIIEKAKENKESNSWSSCKISSTTILQPKVKEVNCHRRTAFKSRSLNVFGKKESPIPKRKSKILVESSGTQKLFKKKSNDNSRSYLNLKHSDKLIKKDNSDLLSLLTYKQHLSVNINFENSGDDDEDDNLYTNVDDQHNFVTDENLQKVDKNQSYISSNVKEVSSAPNYLESYMKNVNSNVNDFDNQPSTSSSSNIYNNESYFSVYNSENKLKMLDSVQDINISKSSDELTKKQKILRSETRVKRKKKIQKKKLPA